MNKSYTEDEKEKDITESLKTKDEIFMKGNQEAFSLFKKFWSNLDPGQDLKFQDYMRENYPETYNSVQQKSNRWLSQHWMEDYLKWFSRDYITNRFKMKEDRWIDNNDPEIISGVNPPGWVYVVQCVMENEKPIECSEFCEKKDHDSNHLYACKVGHAGDTNLDQRLSGLRCGAPFFLHLVDAFGCYDASYMEKTIHSHFSSRRLHGEWFYLYEFEIHNILNLEWRKKAFGWWCRDLKQPKTNYGKKKKDRKYK